MGGSENDLRRLSLRILGALVLGVGAFFVLETLWELHRQGLAWDDLSSSPESARALASTVSRAFNNLLAMVLSFVAIAIPITANMYTPKLVEIFFADRVNLVCLALFAALGGHAVLCQWATFQGWHPQMHVAVLVVTGTLGFLVLIPYYLYVVGYLNPATIVRRVRDRVVERLPGPGREASDPRVLLDRIHQLGNVILRSVERADRDVAVAGIEALESCMEDYASHRALAPAAWFEVAPDLFPGASQDALDLLRRERNWVEHACLSQFQLAHAAALTKMPDAVSAISKAARRVARRCAASGDDATLGLAIRFLNTFVRAALNKRDVHAVFDVFHQVRQLAIELLPARPERTAEIVRHLRYYGAVAHAAGLPFVYELAAADATRVVVAAYETDAPGARGLLDAFRAFEPVRSSPRMAKSRALLVALFRRLGRAEEEALLLADLRTTPPEDLRIARRDLAATEDPVFWEVTDRQVNLDYLPPDQRARVLGVLDAASGPQRS